MRGVPRLFQIAVFVRVAISMAITPAYGEPESIGTCVGREIHSKLAQLDSEDQPVFSQLDLSELETKSPELYRFIQSKTLSRILKTQPAPYRMIENNIALATHRAGDISFSINAEEVNASLTVTREERRLVIKINSITLKQPNSSSKLDYGKRNDSLSMGFPRLLAAISTGVGRQIEADPNLQKITLIGGYVINPHLADQLQRFGFVGTTERTPFISGAKRDLSAFVGFFCNTVTQFIGGVFVLQKHENSKIVGKSVKGVAATAATVLKIKSALRNRNIGKTWQLDFDLVRAANQ